jgi:hypothetical protein
MEESNLWEGKTLLSYRGVTKYNANFLMGIHNIIHDYDNYTNRDRMLLR